VKTVVLGARPPEIEAFLARRHALGQDSFDEVWDGDYHVVPAPHAWHGLVDRRLARLLDPVAEAAGLTAIGQFNLGGPDDYRVPDGGYHRVPPSGVWLPTAAVVVEVVSPDDETWEKLGFYARHGVDEICIADPRAREIRWFRLAGDAYEETGASELLGVTGADLEARIVWPG
jgi:Uma2 family endonuclease